MNLIKLLVLLVVFCLPSIGFCQTYRQSLGTDYSYYKVDHVGKSRHRSLDHKKIKKKAKKLGASYYSYQTGTSSYSMGVNSTFNTGNPIYFVRYYNLTPKSDKEIKQFEEAKQKRKENYVKPAYSNYSIEDTLVDITTYQGKYSLKKKYIKDKFFENFSPFYGKWKYSNEIHKSLISVERFDRNGILEKVTFYSKGKALYALYYLKGKLLKKETYNKGKEFKKNYEYEYYNENGNIDERGTVKNYRKVGKIYTYDKNGNLISKKSN